MSILSDFEDRVGRAIEGVFAGVFRSPVQPAELARAAAKEMDRRKKLGVGKVYAPTMYSILLSPEDGEQLGGFADTMAGELETYLMGYAHEHDYELPNRPRVRFLVDEDLKLGRFAVIGELLSPEEIEAEFGTGPHDLDDEYDEASRARAADAAAVAIGASAGGAGIGVGAGAAGAAGAAAAASASAGAVVPAPVAGPLAGLGDISDGEDFDPESTFAPDDSAPIRPVTASRIATVTVPGIAHDVALTGSRMVLGRLASCDIQMQDANASREHVALVHEDGSWFAEDLGSTNGTLVNGRPIRKARLTDGDVITIGITELVYHESGR